MGDNVPENSNDGKTRVWQAKLNSEHYEHNQKAMNHLNQLFPATHLVTGCRDCPLAGRLFDYEEYHCSHTNAGNELLKYENYDSVHGNGSPDWCPLKEKSITIKLINQ